ncbi:hypothetical protein DRZ78_00040 [Candidatus Aerophobetes bacterium]|uniref:Uncharacterized protein n=1 Tax=Aerophobetes bacterium TaxID=2030807 RepID=A0A662D652_UNCAE|nr:MAG: hypothetical protein DRZ78_00040 [Candidatus Aerophobetes bacterium]
MIHIASCLVGGAKTVFELIANQVGSNQMALFIDFSYNPQESCKRDLDLGNQMLPVFWGGIEAMGAMSFWLKGAYDRSYESYKRTLEAYQSICVKKRQPKFGACVEYWKRWGLIP